MIFHYLDASAWVKRYYRETGTDWVQGLFTQNSTMACASLGVVEVIATLARKRKAGEINPELSSKRRRRSKRTGIGLSKFGSQPKQWVWQRSRQENWPFEEQMLFTWHQPHC